jgi:glycerol-3-phosphate acyltransferase PlsX
LKTLEGGVQAIVKALLDAFASAPEYKSPADALLPALLPLYDTLDPDTYGGAMLLGVEGVCVISHGSSGARAMVNAIKVGQEMVDADVVGRLRAAVSAQ